MRQIPEKRTLATVGRQAHSKDFANLEAEAYRSMSMYQLEAGASMSLLDRAEAALKEGHKVPQALANEEMAAVLRTRVERALAANNKEVAGAALKTLQSLAEANGADGLIETALHGAAGAMALAQGNYADAVNQFEEDDNNAISMRSLITAYEKNGQEGNARRLGSKLASLNVPLIEQALVVPEFRKQRAAVTARTNPALDPRGKYR